MTRSVHRAASASPPPPAPSKRAGKRSGTSPHVSDSPTVAHSARPRAPTAPRVVRREIIPPEPQFDSPAHLQLRHATIAALQAGSRQSIEFLVSVARGQTNPDAETIAFTHTLVATVYGFLAIREDVRDELSTIRRACVAFDKAPHINVAIDLLRAGAGEHACAWVQRLINQHPDRRVHMLLTFARAAEKQASSGGDAHVHEAALWAVRQLMEQPKCLTRPRYQEMLGFELTLLRALGRRIELIATLKKQYEFEPDLPDSAALLAHQYERLGDPVRATAWLDTSFEKRYADLECLRLQTHVTERLQAAGVPLLGRAIDSIREMALRSPLRPEERAEVLLKLVGLHPPPEQRRALLFEARRHAPLSPQDAIHLSRLVQLGGSVVQLKSAFKKASPVPAAQSLAAAAAEQRASAALVAEPTSTAAHRQAQEILRAALDQHPESMPVRRELLKVANLLGDRQAISVAYLSLARREPDNLGQLRAAATHFAGCQAYSDAAEMLVLARKVEPQDLGLCLDLARYGRAANKSKLRSEIQAALRTALQLQPDHPEALLLLAHVRHEGKQHAAAQDLFERAAAAANTAEEAAVARQGACAAVCAQLAPLLRHKKLPPALLRRHADLQAWQDGAGNGSGQLAMLPGSGGGTLPLQEQRDFGDDAAQLQAPRDSGHGTAQPQALGNSGHDMAQLHALWDSGNGTVHLQALRDLLAEARRAVQAPEPRSAPEIASPRGSAAPTGLARSTLEAASPRGSAALAGLNISEGEIDIGSQRGPASPRAAGIPMAAASQLATSDPLERQSIWPPAAVRAGTTRAAVLAETALRRGSATPRSLPAACAAPGRTITNLATASKLIGALDTAEGKIIGVNYTDEAVLQRADGSIAWSPNGSYADRWLRHAPDPLANVPAAHRHRLPPAVRAELDALLALPVVGTRTLGDFVTALAGHAPGSAAPPGVRPELCVLRGSRVHHVLLKHFAQQGTATPQSTARLQYLEDRAQAGVVSDIDLGTSMPPQQAFYRCSALSPNTQGACGGGGVASPLFVQYHGVNTYHDHPGAALHLDVASFCTAGSLARRQALEGAHTSVYPKVFGTCLKAWAEVQAFAPLFYNFHTGEILDPTGTAWDDLQQGVLRIASEAGHANPMLSLLAAKQAPLQLSIPAAHLQIIRQEAARQLATDPVLTAGLIARAAPEGLDSPTALLQWIHGPLRSGLKAMQLGHVYKTCLAPCSTARVLEAYRRRAPEGRFQVPASGTWQETLETPV